MAVKGKADVIPIEVSSRIIRHVSRGIYRTPAAALKELVSNSYDARATEVTINTGFPVFETMTIRDNGDGMTRDDFERFITQIGLTDKVAGTRIAMPPGHKERHFIGHFGIGLLAIGQLAKQATITSKPVGRDEGFVAEIDFEQFEIQKDDGLDRAIVKGETEIAKRERESFKDKGPDAKLPIGECRIRDVTFDPEDRDQSFTEIVLETIRLEVKKKLSGEIRDRANPEAVRNQKYSANFQRLLALVREREGHLRQGQYPYEMLCWELALYCPVPYRPLGPFKDGGALHHLYALAQRYDFSLKVDGFRLTKPFEEGFFSDEENPVENIYVWKEEKCAYRGGSLKIAGYLMYKRQIRPKLLQGILVREGGVAVGLYDTRFLEYPFYEGWKFNQLTGELYVEGLSGALNIDRNSFNETDDSYLALAGWLHGKLQSEVFPSIKATSKESSARPRAKNIEVVRRVLSRYVSEVGGNYKRVDFENLGRQGPLLKAESGRLVINQQHPDGSGSGAKADKLVFIASLVIRGRISPDEVDEMQALISRLKSEVAKA